MKEKKSSDCILNELCEALHLQRDSQLAEWLGVSAQAVSQARRKGKIPESWLIQAAARAGLSLDSLVFGHGPLSSTNEEDSLLLVPLVAARLSAGGGSLETEGQVVDRLAFQVDWLRKKGNPDNMILMRVTGDSMEPVIHHNDIVLVDQGKKNIIPHTVFAIGVDDEIYIKQLETQPGHRLVLRSFNERYTPIEIDMRGDMAESIRILGKVLWWCHEA